ncbi:DUF418 domain-containing protein [Lysinibacillus sp. MHQ-1]|nr:DUF418 domain-containing protein [Lysinibacillus sp. MHQ-1]
MGGSQLLALGYVSLAALLYKTRPVQLLAPAFESVGKLSLTNYLLQTIICTTVFLRLWSRIIRQARYLWWYLIRYRCL